MFGPGAALFAGGSILGYIGAKKSADNAGEIAMEQLAERRRTRDMALGASDIDMAAAMPTAAELATLEKQLAYLDRVQTIQMAALERDEKLMEQAAPGIMEAGNQAYKLLKGQEAEALRPIRQQREMQRRMLENSLAKQLGSGFGTSSAGIEALTRFDMETDMLMAQVQNQTMNQLMGYSMQGFNAGANQMAQGSATVGSLTGQRMANLNVIQGRQQDAARARMQAIMGTDVTPYAGAQHVGSLMMGQYWQQQGSMLQSMGARGMGMGIGGGDPSGGMGSGGGQPGPQGTDMGSFWDKPPEMRARG